MRIAFVDILFAWPPHGGACVDLYHTVSALQAAGEDVHLFMATLAHSRDRAGADPASLPFPATELPFTKETFTREGVVARMREAIDAWGPEAVFVCDAFFLKPYLIEALAHYPTVARYYMYEATAPYDPQGPKGGWDIETNFLETPDRARRRTLRGLRGEMLRGRLSSWAQEYLMARAYRPEYHGRTLRALRALRGIVVYNALQRELLKSLGVPVHVVPGGVAIGEFAYTDPAPRAEDARTVILMSGRAEDPAKGFGVLRAACEKLAAQREDFELRVTHADPAIATPWLRPIGWQSPNALREAYRAADICVTPSIWEEPFGIVAVEAMASGRPVVVSQVGGLGGIPIDGESGYVVPPGDVEALAARLTALLDSPALRRTMGLAARARAEAHFAWPRIVARDYPPILEALKA